MSDELNANIDITVIPTKSEDSNGKQKATGSQASGIGVKLPVDEGLEIKEFIVETTLIHEKVKTKVVAKGNNKMDEHFTYADMKCGNDPATPSMFLNGSSFNILCLRLGEPISNNWELVAQHMGYSYEDRGLITITSQRNNTTPARVLIIEWWSNTPNVTLTELRRYCSVNYSAAKVIDEYVASIQPYTIPGFAGISNIKRDDDSDLIETHKLVWLKINFQWVFDAFFMLTNPFKIIFLLAISVSVILNFIDSLKDNGSWEIRWSKLIRCASNLEQAMWIVFAYFTWPIIYRERNTTVICRGKWVGMLLLVITFGSGEFISYVVANYTFSFTGIPVLGYWSFASEFPRVMTAMSGWFFMLIILSDRTHVLLDNQHCLHDETPIESVCQNVIKNFNRNYWYNVELTCLLSTTFCVMMCFGLILSYSVGDDVASASTDPIGLQYMIQRTFNPLILTIVVSYHLISMTKQMKALRNLLSRKLGDSTIIRSQFRTAPMYLETALNYNPPLRIIVLLFTGQILILMATLLTIIILNYK